VTKIHFFHENKMTKLRTTLTCLVLCLLHSVEGEELREEQIIAPVMETCRFLDHANGVVMPEVPHWTVKDCPCYHRDSPNDTACKLVENRSSKEVVDDPLIPCFFLPRHFLQCNEPVDHHDNASASFPDTFFSATSRWTIMTTRVPWKPWAMAA